MTTKHALSVVWAKAFGDIYCHHASLFIPYFSTSLFPPENVLVGITVRTNIIEKGKTTKSIDSRVARFLPCKLIDGGIEVALNSSAIIDAISLNSWTSLRDGSRGKQKEFPINMFYKIENDEVLLTFGHNNTMTPYLICEDKFAALTDGDKIEAIIPLDIPLDIYCKIWCCE